MKTIPDYVPDYKVSAGQFRKLENNDIAILKIYPIYRQFFDKPANKFHTAKAFPARLTADVVYRGDPEAKKQEGDTFFFREQFWDDNEKKFGFRKIKNDGAFYKAYKKVVDMDIVVNGSPTIEVYDKEEKKKVNVQLSPNTVVTLQGFPVSKLISLIETFDLDADVELVDGKDKAWKPAKVRPFDFEEPLIPTLVGKTFSFKARGTGLDTKYSYKEWKEFDLVPASPLASELTEEEMPF